MALAASDQLGGALEDLLGVELHAWIALAAALNLMDTFEWHHDQLAFTWDNHRMDTNNQSPTSQRILKRLDCFYISINLMMEFPVSHIEVVPSSLLNDHLPIQLILQHCEPTHRGPFRMQASHLSNITLQEYIQID